MLEWYNTPNFELRSWCFKCANLILSFRIPFAFVVRFFICWFITLMVEVTDLYIQTEITDLAHVSITVGTTCVQKDGLWGILCCSNQPLPAGGVGKVGRNCRNSFSALWTRGQSSHIGWGVGTGIYQMCLSFGLIFSARAFRSMWRWPPYFLHPISRGVIEYTDIFLYV